MGAWQQGKTKVFLREAMECELEEQRRRKLHMYAVIIQRVVSCLYTLYVSMYVAKASEGFKD